MAPSAKSVTDKLRQFDAYPKTLEDFQIKTFSGAAVTIVAGIIMALLFLSELYDYLTPHIAEDLFVDTTRGSKLRINLDVVFPTIPCEMLSLDAMDLSGEQHINIQHNIYKRKLDIDGRPIEDPVKQETIGHNDKKSGSDKATDDAADDAAKEREKKDVAEEECGSCFGAEHGELKCCNTCEEVKEAYRKKGWALPPLKDITQCVKEGKTRESLDLPKEGCQIYGYMEVNRVGGNFHFAPGKSFQHSHLHIHDVQQYRTSDFDLSHRIRHLSFGINIPGKTNPLDSFVFQTEKGPKTVTYYLKIVPTTYQKSDGSTLMTNQFSVTKHEKSLSLSHGETGLPGIFFSYELSPLMVKYQEKKKSLGHFLTGVCAIIGGVFTVAGLIDALIYHSSKALQKKIEIGKAT